MLLVLLSFAGHISMGHLVPYDRITSADDNQRTHVAQQDVDDQKVGLCSGAGRPTLGAYLANTDILGRGHGE